jgi:uncharacterized protein
MNIWIDLANSPQVVFFRPIIHELLNQGHAITVSVRAYAQTIQLTQRYCIDHVVIGDHGGPNLCGLIIKILFRSILLVDWGRKQGFDLAISHNSYSQVVAAKIMGIPVITLMDYEHQPLNHLCFRLAKRVIVPEPFPIELINKYGAKKKTVIYPGVKEQVYLSDFNPDYDFRKKEGIPDHVPLVVIRPPAPWTAYHRFENDLFDKLLYHITSLNDLFILFLPRLESQADSVRHLPGITIADHVYDGPDLMYHADMVISGGGTMNRESAVIGTTTKTVFKGKLGAVDRYLIEKGRMEHVRTIKDIHRIAIQKDKRKKTLLNGSNSLNTIVDEILSTI